ncbi:hypothetical protein D6C84_06329 [Aureobasidium pullulans]|uniref:RTA1-domain-containing protein n=1 Tax=Aureobasidium pullulans TaxID=5580 RepID=A0A4S9XP94_AURPU|nr:hypothetical protein D6C84_06329 [Aureobasidium pullulans]
MSVSYIDGEIAWTHPDGTLYLAGGDSANCTIAACPVDLSVYGYRPSIAASSVLIVLYAICTCIQVFLGLRYKSWWFMGCMVLGCLDEILGYAGRIMYWQNPWNDTGFLMQIVLITIGPVFFAAAVYVLLSQIVTTIAPDRSRFNPKWYVWTFISCDIVSLVLQAAGGGISSSSSGSSTTGVDIALAGLSIQVITLFVFVVIVIDYTIRSRSVWSKSSLPGSFKIFCAGLAIATALILVRCSYRIYELSEGYSRDSKALRDEPLFIALESVMIVVSAYCLIAAHPGLGFRLMSSATASETSLSVKSLEKHTVREALSV